MRSSLSLATAAVILLAPFPPARAQETQDLATLVSLASGWASRFELSLSGMLFRESYRQSATTEGPPTGMTASPLGVMRGGNEGNRGSLFFEANIFMVKPDLAETWVVYRDIYSLGARELTDHTDRLEAILLENTEASRSRAQRLTDASARLNVGEVLRNTNIPTMVYEFLRPASLPGLRVRRAGRDRINGMDVVIVEFEEIGRPTLIRGPDDSEVPVTGQFWIHPASGVVPRAKIEMQAGRYTGRLQVELELHPVLKSWVPVKMLEVWHSGNWRINGFAVYDRFKRLAVGTDEIIK